MNYNLNINNLLRDALPSFLRGNRQLEWLQMLTKPVKALRDTFLAFIDKTNRELTWNGQTVAMEDLLNQRFGDGIEIKNENPKDKPFFIYGPADARNPTVYQTGNQLNPIAGAVGAFDPNRPIFTVKVPGTLLLSPDDFEEMTALINKYKIYSKRFKIQLI